MKRAARRHLLFFSTSLAAHLIFVFMLVGVCFLVSDTGPVDADRPLVVSLQEDGAAILAADPGRTEVGRMERAMRTERAVRDVSPTEASENSVPADGGIVAGDSGGLPRIGGAGNGTDSTLLSDYIESVHVRINRHKRYPPGAARDGIEGTVTVSFLLDRRGTVLEKGIVAGSGHPVLDAAALDAVVDASPFPPLPDGLHRETLRLRIPINYKQR
jgi:TonB family protein